MSNRPVRTGEPTFGARLGRQLRDNRSLASRPQSVCPPLALRDKDPARVGSEQPSVGIAACYRHAVNDSRTDGPPPSGYTRELQDSFSDALALSPSVWTLLAGSKHIGRVGAR